MVATVRGHAQSADGATVSVPPETVTGDLLVLWAAGDGIPTTLAHPGEGWQQLHNYDGYVISGAAWWKAAEAGDLGATITFNTGAPGRATASVVAVADAAVPLAGFGYAAMDEAGTPPAITVTASLRAAHDVALYFGAAYRSPVSPAQITLGHGSVLHTYADGGGYVMAVTGAEATGASDAVTQTFTGGGDGGFFAVALVSGGLANDDFAAAAPVTITADGGTYLSPLSAPTTGYTLETGEPEEQLGTGENISIRTAWWSYTPLASGTALIDTGNSSRQDASDTILNVYTGATLAGLTTVAVSDDGDLVSDNTSQLELAVTGGVTYWLRVGLYGPEERPSSYVLRVSGPRTQDPPGSGGSGGDSGGGGAAVSSSSSGTPTYTLDGWTGNATDSAGVQWIITEEAGWSDAAPIRLAAAERAGTDGAVSGRVLRGARLISLRGTAVAPGRIPMLEAKERLRAVAAAGSYTLTVAEAHLTRQVQVKQFSELKIADFGSYAFRFELSLRADDPLRYGTTPRQVQLTLAASTGGTAMPLSFPFQFSATGSGNTGVVINDGNATTYPVLTISGPVSNPVVRNASTDRRIALGIDVAAGETVTVDHASGRVLLNGTASRLTTLLPGSSWWGLPPGASQISFSAATSTGAQLAVTYRPAWT